MIKNILLITILLLISSCSNYKSVVSNKVNGETQKPILMLEDTSKDVLLSKVINPQNLDTLLMLMVIYGVQLLTYYLLRL